MELIQQKLLNETPHPIGGKYINNRKSFRQMILQSHYGEFQRIFNLTWRMITREKRVSKSYFIINQKTSVWSIVQRKVYKQQDGTVQTVYMEQILNGKKLLFAFSYLLN
ncbi:unnamed protein product [Paramecium primaurelia]|uniref:Uncharacterized protein n=1 Tax=Paramecium primaurelia TaxID=5886 RepID=A0A8S1QXT0_PARPR|nr:unnamed protein product [Paramecium primaurelia]